MTDKLILACSLLASGCASIDMFTLLNDGETRSFSERGPLYVEQSKHPWIWYPWIWWWVSRWIHLLATEYSWQILSSVIFYGLNIMVKPYGPFNTELTLIVICLSRCLWHMNLLQHILVEKLKKMKKKHTSNCIYGTWNATNKCRFLGIFLGFFLSALALISKLGKHEIFLDHLEKKRVHKNFRRAWDFVVDTLFWTI